MEKSPENDAKFRLEVKPDAVVSDGQHDVTVKVVFPTHKDKQSKEEYPVTLSCPKQRISEEKTTQKGSVTFKFRPVRPTGKTPIHIHTPLGDRTVRIRINPTPAQYTRDMVTSILFAFIIAFGIIRPFFIQTYWIPSDSMQDTMYQGDRLVGLMFSYRFRDPKPGEIVIFNRKGEVVEHKFPFFTWKSQTNFIKRVIAVGGDTIEVRDLTVYVNNKPLKEPYIKQPPLYNMPPVKVPKGSYFCMGDNRNNSNDSHVWGPLPGKYIKSKAWLMFWPPNRAGLIK